MEESVVTKVFLPIALAVIMLGMGLSLTTDDFKRVMIYPKAAVLGMLNQLILLPIVAFVYAKIFPLSPELAVGLMILAICPGGVTSNLISHISKGDTALSITLTAISGVITVITIPFILSFSLEHFMAEGEKISLPIGRTILQIFVITIIPILMGMSIRFLAESFADKMGKPV
ncbi:TPA: bile acid:sodium symporter, partial [Candidatus Poribacteria bacterium]|nr:bile acid:sodium symporter [Candidatus Poribacteria bacterium]